ncbi:MAG TPA: aldehyde dehydrogenase family protein [Bacteroidales bacterium]|nr:aldehyde dehydrogenase family protein [Bacteroidales bacterium]
MFPETFPAYCAGHFIETLQKLEVRNPYNGEVVGKTFLAGPAKLENAITSALNTREPMRLLDSFRRYEALMYIASGIENMKQLFAETICRESAKPIRYALAEVDRSIQTFRVAAEESRRLPGEYLSLDWTPAGAGKEAWVKHFPVGVVAGIAPFNFPLNLAVHKIAPAIAAGCPIILKPSTSTPLSTLLLARIISEAGLPKGAVSILPMDRATGNALVTDSRLSLLSFTGSPVVGWKMKAAAGRKKVVLELGGNAGVIISAIPDIEEALNKCITGAFSYSGQVCIHTQLIYVLKAIFNEFASRFVAKTTVLKTGDPMDPATDISVMIDEENACRVESWVLEAVEGGAEILCGGRRNGGFYEPTVVTQTKPGMNVCCSEIFGPVVVIEPVESIRDAVGQINQGCFGLQAGIFTDSLAEMNYAFEHLEAGGVIVNDVPTFRVDHMPYGGIKNSGLGREGVRYAMFDMLEPKLLVRNKY